MIDYNLVVDTAKDAGFIKEGEKYLFCVPDPKDGRRSGSFVEVLTYKYDILLVVNENELRLYDVDKKTGELLGTVRVFKKENLRKIVVSWFLSWNLYFRTKEPDYYDNITLNPRFGKFTQKELLKDMVQFIKLNYKKNK